MGRLMLISLTTAPLETSTRRINNRCLGCGVGGITNNTRRRQGVEAMGMGMGSQ